MTRPAAKPAAATTGMPLAPRATPIKVAVRLPVITAHGCAKGLDGATNSNTAVAAAGAANGSITDKPKTPALSDITSASATPIPTEARSHSIGRAIRGSGTKDRHQSKRRSCMNSTLKDNLRGCNSWEKCPSVDSVLTTLKTRLGRGADTPAKERSDYRHRRHYAPMNSIAR